MTGWPILSLITFLPLVGAFFCLIVNGPKEAVERNCRSIALVTTVFGFISFGNGLRDATDPKLKE